MWISIKLKFNFSLDHICGFKQLHCINNANKNKATKLNFWSRLAHKCNQGKEDAYVANRFGGSCLISWSKGNLALQFFFYLQIFLMVWNWRHGGPFFSKYGSVWDVFILGKKINGANILVSLDSKMCLMWRSFLLVLVIFGLYPIKCELILQGLIELLFCMLVFCYENL